MPNLLVITKALCCSFHSKDIAYVKCHDCGAILNISSQLESTIVIFPFQCAVGKSGLWAHLVWGFPCEELLPEKPPNQWDPNRDAVPFPELERPEGSCFHKITSRFSQVQYLCNDLLEAMKICRSISISNNTVNYLPSEGFFFVFFTGEMSSSLWWHNHVSVYKFGHLFFHTPVIFHCCPTSSLFPGFKNSLASHPGNECIYFLCIFFLWYWYLSVL